MPESTPGTTTTTATAGGLYRVISVNVIGPQRLYAALLQGAIRARRAGVPDRTAVLPDATKEHVLFPFTTE